MRAVRFARAQARYSFLSGAAVAILCGLIGCGATNPVKPHTGSAPQAEVIYVISGGWHTERDAAVVKGMLARGDRQGDIAAFFKVNSGRICEINTGRQFTGVAPAAPSELPPPGPYEPQAK